MVGPTESAANGNADACFFHAAYLSSTAAIRLASPASDSSDGLINPPALLLSRPAHTFRARRLQPSHSPQKFLLSIIKMTTQQHFLSFFFMGCLRVSRLLSCTPIFLIKICLAASRKATSTFSLVLAEVSNMNEISLRSMNYYAIYLVTCRLR